MGSFGGFIFHGWVGLERAIWATVAAVQQMTRVSFNKFAQEVPRAAHFLTYRAFPLRHGTLW